MIDFSFRAFFRWQKFRRSVFVLVAFPQTDFEPLELPQRNPWKSKSAILLNGLDPQRRHCFTKGLFHQQFQGAMLLMVLDILFFFIKPNVGILTKH